MIDDRAQTEFEEAHACACAICVPPDAAELQALLKRAVTLLKLAYVGSDIRLDPEWVVEYRILLKDLR